MHEALCTTTTISLAFVPTTMTCLLTEFSVVMRVIQFPVDSNLVKHGPPCRHLNRNSYASVVRASVCTSATAYKRAFGPKQVRMRSDIPKAVPKMQTVTDFVTKDENRNKPKDLKEST